MAYVGRLVIIYRDEPNGERVLGVELVTTVGLTVSFVFFCDLIY